MRGIGTKCVMMTTLLVSIYLLKVNNRNTRARCEICSKLAIKTHENMKASVNFLTLNVPIPDKVKNLSQVFIFTLLCGTSKGFMKALNLLRHHKEV